MPQPPSDDPPALPRPAEGPLRLGGMALRNGLLIHGPTHWSIAARRDDGTIGVRSGRKPRFTPGRSGQVPLLRGPLRLAEAFAVVPLARLRLRSARLPFEDPRVLAVAAATNLAAAALAKRISHRVGSETAAAALGLLPAAVALSSSELAAYHGAEHKAIGAYELGDVNAASAPKEHERCGSNLVGPMLALSIAGQVVLERLIERPGRISRGVAAAGSVGAAVEFFAWSERNPSRLGARAMHRTGHEIQRLLATREPTAEQLAVGEAALAEILRVEGAPTRVQSAPAT